MVVTDGSPETYEEIFVKYNAPNYEVILINTVRHASGRLLCFKIIFHLTFNVFYQNVIVASISLFC